MEESSITKLDTAKELFRIRFNIKTRIDPVHRRVSLSYSTFHAESDSVNNPYHWKSPISMKN